IMEYLVNISKRRALWSLNKDILKITVLITNTPYPLRKIQLLFGRRLRVQDSSPYSNAYRGKCSPVDKGLPSMVSDEGTIKTTPCLEGPHGDKDSEGFKSPADMEPLTTPIANPSGTDAKYQADQTQSTRLSLAILKKYDNILPLTERQLVKYLKKVSHVLFTKHTEDSWDKHEEVTAFYADLKWSLKDFIHTSFNKYNNNDAALRNFQCLLDLFKTDHNTSMRRILENLKEVQNAVKEDPVLNKKVLEATKAYTKNSTNLTKLLTLDQHLASWDKSSTSMAWNLRLRMTAITSSQAAIRSEISSLRQDTSDIKSMMTKIYNSFNGQPFPIPSIHPSHHNHILSKNQEKE
ncbi:hypothetical protein Tco_1088451, partial [Tanacetum coccineum]